jgi:hypothetical protein
LPVDILFSLLSAAFVLVFHDPPSARAASPQGFPTLTKGDNDCDDDIDAADALAILHYLAGDGSFYGEQPTCSGLGFPIGVGGGGSAALAGVVVWIFGDVDCDFDVDASDAMFILRFVAGMSVNLPGSCPPIVAPQ